MSKATKRKHVVREVEQEFVLPQDDDQIVRVIAGRGNNLHEVQDGLGESFLVSMPPKFRKNVWIKRGDFVMVTPIEEGDKVKAEIAKILYKDQIDYIKQEGKWPKQFLPSVTQTQENMNKLKISQSESGEELSEDDDSDNDDDLFQNTNRPIHNHVSEEETSSEENDESNDELDEVVDKAK